MRDAVIVDALRTPVGRYAGALAAVRPDDLAARTIEAVVERIVCIAITPITSRTFTASR